MDSLQSIFELIKRDKYTTTDKVDANGAEHSEANGQFVSKGDSKGASAKPMGAAAKLRADFSKNTDKYLNKPFTNKSTGTQAMFTKKSQDELRSRTSNTKENGFTIQQHFEVANQIKELFEDADLIKEHEDTKHGDKNLRIERFLSKPLTLKSGDEVQACITVKHVLNPDGRSIYSIEAMDIKNALDKTRAKGQHQDGPLSDKNSISHDGYEVKSLCNLWQMLKGA